MTQLRFSEDHGTPGQWRVEWFDDDGRCQLEIFTGPAARRDALRYAGQKYGHFKEVQLEPYLSRIFPTARGALLLARLGRAETGLPSFARSFCAVRPALGNVEFGGFLGL